MHHCASIVHLDYAGFRSQLWTLGVHGDGTLPSLNAKSKRPCAVSWESQRCRIPGGARPPDMGRSTCGPLEGGPAHIAGPPSRGFALLFSNFQLFVLVHFACGISNFTLVVCDFVV